MSTTPVDPIVELLIDGEWVDITADVRLDSADSGGGLEISRGVPNEGNATEPTQFNFTLNNVGGKYSPKNPLSPYYGKLGRNQPVRVGLSRRLDTFQRTVAAGSWGNLPPRTLPDGTVAPTETWKIAGTASNFSVVPGEARIQCATGWRLASFGTFGDVEVSCRVKTSSLTSGFGILMRADTDVPTWYSVHLTPGTPDNLSFHKVSPGTNRLTTTTRSPAIVANTWYRMKAQLAGQRMRVKIWTDGTAEPNNWYYRTYDTLTTSEVAVPLAGSVGVFGLNGTGIVTFSEVEVNQWRAHTEIAELPPRWDLSRNDRWVPVKSRGILRRLGQGRKALSSAVTKHLSSYANPGLWLPMEEDSGSEQAGNLTPGGRPGAVKLLTYNSADEVNLPGLAGYATLSEDTSSIVGQVKPYAATGSWTFLTFLKMDTAPASNQVLFTVGSTGTIRNWRFTLTTGMSIQIDGLDRYNTVLTTDSTLVWNFASIPNGSWVAMTLYLFDSGGNVNWALNYTKVGSGVFFTSGTNVVAGASGTMTSVWFRSSAVLTAAGGLSVGTIFHYPGDLPFVTDSFHKAANAYRGESSTIRWLRLNSEAKLVGMTTGFSGDGHPMGAQLPAKLLDLLEECADVEGGILMEERDSFGLTIFIRYSYYNLPVVSLDIDEGHLTEPLDPTDDDQGTRNDVTVRRPQGSFATSVQTEGPLNINSPETDPDGVGIYDEAPEVNFGEDGQLQAAANWRRSAGTLPDARYPGMHADLTAEVYQADPALAAAVASLDSGRPVLLTNVEVSPNPVEQTVRSYTEKIDQYDWDLTFVTVPGTLYRVGVVGYTTRLDTSYIVTQADFDAGTDTALLTERTDTTKGLWVLPADHPASFPLVVEAAGVRLRVTSASGTSDPQTLTVDATPVNGQVKTIPAGSQVKVVDPWRVAW